MKTKTIIIFLLLAQFTFGQEKEWDKVVDLLSIETDYFSDKSGYFRLTGNAVTDFKYLKLSLNDSVFVSEMHHTNRFDFDAVSDKEAFVTTKIHLLWFPFVKSAQIVYDHTAYFDEFPKQLFLKIEFQEPLPQITTVKFKNGKTETENTETFEVIVPIRTKNREKILNAIDAYLATDFKKELDNDTEH